MGTSFSIIADVHNDYDDGVAGFEKIAMTITVVILILVFLFFSVRVIFFLHCPTCGKYLIPRWHKINAWERLDSIGGPTEWEFIKGYVVIWQCQKCDKKYHFKKYKIVPLYE